MKKVLVLVLIFNIVLSVIAENNNVMDRRDFFEYLSSENMELSEFVIKVNG